jgi:hypothetical protein
MSAGLRRPSEENLREANSHFATMGLEVLEFLDQVVSLHPAIFRGSRITSQKHHTNRV